MTTRSSGLEARLAGWRRNVGGAIELDLAPPLISTPPAISVISWNVWIGRGRVLELVERYAAGGLGVPGEPPLVLLLQEAYRRDDSIPERSNGFSARDLVASSGVRHDIVEITRRLGWNLRYVPSMRNGPERSDRGNAILTPLPIGPAVATELPFALQRRVAVSAGATISGHPVQLVSAHLDPRGPVGYKWLGAAARARQTDHLLAGLESPTVILGADLNIGRGRAEGAWRRLVEHGFEFGVPAVPPAWRHTFHSLPRLVIDYLLVRNRAGVIRASRVRRLDEDPRDRGRYVFGSDHHPLLAEIEVVS